MKRKTAQSNNDTAPMVARDFPSLRNLESLHAELPIAQWQQYAEAGSRMGLLEPSCGKYDSSRI